MLGAVQGTHPRNSIFPGQGKADHETGPRVKIRGICFKRIDGNKMNFPWNSLILFDISAGI